MNKSNGNIAIGLGIGLLTGAAIGGVVASLFAPKSGEETRELIGNKTNEVVKSVEEKAAEAINTVKEAASEVNRKGQAAAYAVTH